MKKSLIIIGILIVFSVLSNLLNAQELRHITAEEFKQEIFDYKTQTEWQFDGETPIVIDFYATWCGPCKRVAPILEELQQQYNGKVRIFKVNIDKEKELAGVFGVRSIPTFLFIPKNGKPTMAKGALPKETFQQAFHELFGF